MSGGLVDEVVERGGRLAFRVLGPIEVTGAGGPVRIPPGRQQVILACLLLEANKVVSTDHLVDALWEVNPPDTARTQVQICVSRLRKTLADAGVEVSIVTRPPGYQLRLPDASLDVHEFTRGVTEGRAAARRGELSEASELLRASVGLWRGECLSGLASAPLRTRALRLEEDRLNAVETCLGIDLELGLHHELVGEIGRLVREHPLRERPRALLMLALYRSGRKAEALEVYREGRDLLVEELGLEPGEELRELERAIHAGDASLLRGPEPARERRPAEPADAARAAVPRQLPADTADFIGGEELITAAEEVLTGGAGRRAVGVVVVIGRPGVGKSTLAAHLGHRVAEEHFPDGQLYCDLRGGYGDAGGSADVLGRFLQALGIPGAMIPVEHTARTEMYRTLLADRRVLVVLDNAVSERQVLPLLPGGGRCAVVVTSRARLTGLPGARQLELDVLDREQSLELLGRVVGERRVAGEPEAAEALVRTVGGLPLALRIVAARLAARPHWSLASMVHRLASERHRLDELAHGEMTIRASLSLTHDGLDQPTRRLFGLLSLAEGPSLPGWVAGAALDDGRPYASDLIEPLVDVQMLDVVSVDGTGEFRYRFHDIIRLFAREQLASVDEREQREVQERVLGGWLSLAEQAHRGVFGGDFTALHGSAPRWHPHPVHAERLLESPLEWLEGELPNLRAAVAQAARLGLDELCWDLAVTTTTLFEARGHLDDWRHTHDEALRATRAAGNARGTAALLASLGTLHINRGRAEESGAVLVEALAAFTELGDVRGQALCRRDLGLLTRQAGDDAGALALYGLALAGFEEVGDVVGRAIVLTQRAHVLMRTGRDDEALAQLAEAMATCREVGYTGGVATTMRRIGQVQLHRGEHELAERTLTEVLEMVRASRDVIGEGHLLHNLGEVNAAAGRVEAARECFERSLAVRERMMDHGGVAVVRRELALLEGKVPA
ncbi:AfsR/SARP family transcriptional regulator [Actinosynnema pretiosum]|uniref:AfsR/SARP family transcriptional regulator n=1 Tax=Actinosynnema pretiosum TaxID=42197 RepID=UPI001E3639D7|nr:AfsR/SARP family transcriptional regulator [Actinosynnema pretiosum]